MKVRLNLATSPLESNRRFAVGASLIGSLAVLGLLLLSWNGYRVWRVDKVIRSRQAGLEKQIAVSRQRRQMLASFFYQPETAQRLRPPPYLNTLTMHSAFALIKTFSN